MRTKKPLPPELERLLESHDRLRKTLRALVATAQRQQRELNIRFQRIAESLAILDPEDASSGRAAEFGDSPVATLKLPSSVPAAP